MDKRGECGGPDLAAKLNKLVATMHRRDELPVSDTAAVAGIEAKTGVRLTVDEFRRLRAGTALPEDVSVARLQAIAEYFGVAGRYLAESGAHDDISRQLDLLALMRDNGIRDVSPCAGESAADVLTVLRAVIDRPAP